MRTIRTLQHGAEIHSEAIDTSGTALARLVERPASRTTSLGSGFVRRLQIEPLVPRPIRLVQALPAGTRIDAAVTRHWVASIWRRDDGVIEVAAARLPEGRGTLSLDARQLVADGPADGSPWSLEWTLLLLASWPADGVTRLAAELER